MSYSILKYVYLDNNDNLGDNDYIFHKRNINNMSDSYFDKKLGILNNEILKR